MRPSPPRPSPLRLSRWDYSWPGWYFVTMVVARRRRMLSSIVDGHVIHTAAGQIVDQVWQELSAHYHGVVAADLIVMPDHVHGLLQIPGPYRNPGPAAHGRLERNLMTLPTAVGLFKSTSARLINLARGTPGTPFWQRNYYERIVRDARQLERVRAYIRNNPRKWSG